MAAYRLDLTGGFRIADPVGTELRLSARKAKALLAILALSPGLTAPRTRLRTILWGDRGEQQASDSLRQQLAQMRKELGETASRILVVRDDQIGLSAADVEIDVLTIRSAASAGDLRRAVDAYGGPLLDGLDINDAGFDDWLASARSSFTEEMIGIFNRAVEAEQGQARIALAQRLVDLDPLRENAQRQLIRAARDTGDRAQAQKLFDSFASLLKKELGTAPSDETKALLDATAPQRPSGSLPSLVVLPFANLSDDKEQRYLSEGIAADVATELQRFHAVVIRAAKGATAPGPADDLVAIGQRLAVSFLVSGNVRRMANRLRINVQLLDVEQALQLWSEKFDVPETELFDVQDRIVQSISAQLIKGISHAVLARARRKPPQSLEAYELVLQAESLHLGDIEEEQESLRLHRQATIVDPTYARAWAGLGFFTHYAWLRDYGAPVTILDTAFEYTRKAVALDDNDAFCHVMHAQILMRRLQHDIALHHFRKALTLNPNDTVAQANMGIMFGYIGEAKRALEYFDQVLRLDPHFNESWFWRDRGIIHFVARQYREAILDFERSPTPQEWTEAYIAASHAYLGDLTAARKHVEQAKILEPSISVERILQREPWRSDDDRSHFTEGLRRAGLA